MLTPPLKNSRHGYMQGKAPILWNLQVEHKTHQLESVSVLFDSANPTPHNRGFDSHLLPINGRIDAGHN
jgi:hypothetical protein